MTSTLQSPGLFQHGVASGDPRSDRVVIWTRVTIDAVAGCPVRWALARDLLFNELVAAGDLMATRASDFTVKVDVGDLEPNTRYYYRFEAGNQFSPIGRTKTLPDGEVQHLRFAQVCCAKLNVGYFNAYSRIADRVDLDFFLHLGDYIYETAEHASVGRLSGSDPRRAYDPPTECRVIDDYRRRYAQYHRDPDLQRLHQALPMIATLDDHELADGAWRGGSEDHEPVRDGDWAERRRAALQARLEWLPLRLPNDADPEQVFQMVSVGVLADLVLLDTRTQRDAPAALSQIHDRERTALGKAQREWLWRQLDSSLGHWRLLVSPTLMTTLTGGATSPSSQQALRTLKLIDLHDDGPDRDPWAGYPQERDALLRHLAERDIKNVVVLSGDVHVALAADLSVVTAYGSEAPVAVEIVTASITSQNLDDKMDWAPRTHSLPIEAALLESLPHLRWCELDSHGYVIVDVTRERVQAEWWFVNTILTPSAGETRAAVWLVEHNRPRLIAEQ